MRAISAVECSKVHADERGRVPGGVQQAGSSAPCRSNAATACGLCLRLEQIKRFICPSGFKDCLRRRGMQRNI